MDYADSVSSSPRSVGTGRNAMEAAAAAAAAEEMPMQMQIKEKEKEKVRLMCSFGGRIMPRPHDNQLCYVGGDSRMVSVPRNICYTDLLAKLCRIFGCTVGIKYQLPNEDLDALISVTTDEDLDNMMEEYDRLQQQHHQQNPTQTQTQTQPQTQTQAQAQAQAQVQVQSQNQAQAQTQAQAQAPSVLPPKQSRLRIFLFLAKSSCDECSSTCSSLGPFLDSSKKEGWFVDALNGTPMQGQVLTRGMSEGSSVVSEVPDFLFGFDNPDWDDATATTTKNNPKFSAAGAPARSKFAQADMQCNPPPDVHSAPDSPIMMMLETSSFGSTSSAPLLANLPPVKVKPDPPPQQQNQNQNQNQNPSQNTCPLPSDVAAPLSSDVAAPADLRYLSDESVRHHDDDGFFNAAHDMGLRSQDPRYFEDHFAKFKNYHQHKQDYEQQQQQQATATVVAQAAVKTTDRNFESRHIPIAIQELEQLQISNKQQPERQVRTPEYAGQEETLDAGAGAGRYNWNLKPTVDGLSSSQAQLPMMKKDDSSSSLSGMNMAPVGLKRDGSQSSQDGGDVRLHAADSMRDRAGPPNLERRVEELDSSYLQKDQTLMAQSQAAVAAAHDHGYLPAQYEQQQQQQQQQQFIPAHYIHHQPHLGQPVSYYQQAQHIDPQHHQHQQQQQQQNEQSYPIYFMPAIQHMGAVMRPMGTQAAGYSVAMPRNVSVAPQAGAGYPQLHHHVQAAETLTSKLPSPAAAAVASTMQQPPMQKQQPPQPQPGYETMVKPTAQFREQQVPVITNMVSGVPRYRPPVARSHVTAGAGAGAGGDVRMVYRPTPAQAQNVASQPLYSDQQYAIQHLHVPLSMGGFDPFSQQMYYTQNPASIAGTHPFPAANLDIQSSSEMLSDAKGARG